MIDMPYLVDCILSLPYKQRHNSVTGATVIEALHDYDYPKSAEYVRAFIARNPDLTTSIKMIPLCTLLNDAALSSGVPLPADVVKECQKQRAFLLDSATQPMSPPAPPRPPSEDKRDFDRPNAPPRPRPDDQRGSPEGKAYIVEAQRWARLHLTGYRTGTDEALYELAKAAYIAGYEERKNKEFKQAYQPNELKARMTANEYQQLAKRTESLVDVFGVDRNSLHDPGPVDYGTSRLLHAAIGCGTEAGELLDGIKKNMWYKKKLDVVNVVEEFGDLLWYIAIGLDALGCTMEEAMQRNINKLKTRYPQKFDAEQAVNRDLDAERSQLEKDAPGFQVVHIKDDIYGTPGIGRSDYPKRETIAHRVDAETGTTYEVHHGAPASAAESVDPRNRELTNGEV